MRRPDRGLILAGLLLIALLWTGAVRAQDAAPAAAAEPPKTRLETRAAIHPGFARLVFAGIGGGASVPFKATATDDSLTIRFERPVEAPLDGVRRALGPYLDQVVAAPDGLTVTAHLKRPVTLQQAAYDRATQVVDLVDKPKPPEATPVAAPEAKPVPATAPGPAKPAPVAVRVGGHGASDRIVFEWPKRIDYKLAQGDGKVQIAFDQAAGIDMARLERALPQRLRPASLSADGTQLQFTLPPGHRVNDTRPGNLVILDVVPGQPPAPVVAPSPPPPPAPVAPPPVVPPPVAQAPPAVVHPPTPPADADQDAPVPTGQVSGTLGSAAENGLQIRYTLIDDGVSLRFEWLQPAAAAIFRRGNAVWMVFDRAQKMDFSDFHAANWPVITAIAQVPSRSGTVLRLNVWAGFNPSVRRAGTAWIVDLRSQPQRAEAPVQGQVRSDGPNASMIFPVSNPSSPISLVDPDAGDVLVTVPLPQLGQGADMGADFPDFRVLPSAQGLVFRPTSDQLAIRAQPGLVELSAPGGLALSSDADRHAERAGKAAQNRVFSAIDWKGDDDFTLHRQALMAAIMTASSDDKNSARLDLARFYFANGQGVEALSVLRAIERDAPGMFDDPTLRALRGASEELANQLDTATADLGDPSLDASIDGQLWRAVLAADRGQWTDALNDYAKSANALKNYPTGLRNRLSIKIAEALLNAGDREKALALVTDVLAHNPTDGEADRAKVVEGRILAIQGDEKQAVALWSEVSKSPDSSLARAQATFAMTMTQYKDGQIARADAIAALDRLRFVWRGDDFEVRILRQLAQLEVADGDYRSAFRALRQVLTSYGDNPASKGVADEMQQYFIDLFLGKASDTIGPLKQLALYDEFKELTPAGAQGDEIIRRLADQLVKVDLLDRAADLLDNQVKTRLTGVDQARVATQLALVRLLDRRPDDAIAALDLPVTGDLPPELVDQRLELRARALTEQGKDAEALALLTGDQSADADRLRVDTYWKTQNWAAVVPALKRGLKPPETGRIDEDTARTVLKIATAMVLGKDRTGLAALQKQYGAAMDQSALKNDFRVVAGDSSSTPGDFKSLADRVAQISDLQGFMTTYRQRLATEQLSKIN